MKGNVAGWPWVIARPGLPQILRKSPNFRLAGWVRRVFGELLERRTRSTATVCRPSGALGTRRLRPGAGAPGY